MDPNELNFLDLVILKKVDENSTVERFGSLINTSFFDTANLLGTLKIKRYIDIQPSVGGMSRVILTEEGREVLNTADSRALEQPDALDDAILRAVSSGKSDLDSLTKALNVRSSDLAYRIEKLVVQQLLDYNVRSAKVYFSLTEKGFLRSGIEKPLTKKEEKSLIERAEKEDVSALLEQVEKVPEVKEEEKKPKELPIRVKRLLSKAEYYAVRYAPHAIALLIILLIGIYLILNRGKII